MPCFQKAPRKMKIARGGDGVEGLYDVNSLRLAGRSLGWDDKLCKNFFPEDL